MHAAKNRGISKFIFHILFIVEPSLDLNLFRLGGGWQDLNALHEDHLKERAYACGVGQLKQKSARWT